MNFAQYDKDGDGYVSQDEMNADIWWPAVVFKDQYTITLSGRHATLIWAKNRHTSDLIEVYFPEERVLFASDYLSINRMCCGFSFDRRPIQTWIDSIKALESLDFDILVNSHFDSGTKSDLTAFRQWLEDLQSAVVAGIKGGKTLDELKTTIKLDKYKSWAGYDAQLPGIVESAYISSRSTLERSDEPDRTEDLARRAIDGDRDALDGLVRALQGEIYGLTLRMLWNREDAEDATQEILVRIVTRLAQFSFRSSLKTWAYRVAVNYVLDVKKSAIERLRLSFDRFGADLTSGLQPVSIEDSEESVLIEEVKVGCTLAMLQCLDRPHRLAFVLGEIVELSGPEAAEALDISPDLFRKRLQHAREAVVAFMRQHCGLVSDSAACHCNRRVPSVAVASRAESQPLQFAERATSFRRARALVRQVDEARWGLELHRSSGRPGSAVDFAERILAAINSLKE